MSQLGSVGVALRLALVAIAVLLACVQQAAGAKGALSASAFDYETCFACELTWRQVHVSVPLNPSAEDVNAAFDEFCANPVPVFEASCRDMAAQRWKMVDDYLAGKSFNSICENAQVCWKGLMMSGM